jgi:hypothetical protein
MTGDGSCGFLQLLYNQIMKFLLLAYLFNLSPLAYSNDDLQSFCQKQEGVIVKGHSCPVTSFPIVTPACLFKNKYSESHFTDGCTGPTGGHRSLFMKSCVKHDLCYHHEPASTGKTQKECDLDFMHNLLDACRSADNYSKCIRWATTMYQSVALVGKFAYRCDNSSVVTY